MRFDFSISTSLFEQIGTATSGLSSMWEASGSLSLKRSAFNLRHQIKTERVQRLSGALRFATICDSDFSLNALVYEYDLAVPIPLAAGLPLLRSGLGGLAWLCRRQKKTANA
jgi:hypothetical protein